MQGLLIRGTIVYGLIRACNRAIPYFLLPYLTLYLSPAEFGSLAIFQASLGMAALLVGLSTSSALNRYYFTLSTLQIASWTYGSVKIIAFNAALLGLIVFFFQHDLSSWFSISAPLLLAVPLTVLGSCVLNVSLDRWRQQMMFGRYAVLNLAQMLIDVCLTVWFVVFISWGVFGRIAGLSASYLTAGILGMVLLYGAGQLAFERKLVDFRKMLGFSVPLVPYALGAWVMTSADRFILSSVLGPGETGIYSIGFLFGSVIVLFQEVLAQAWGPVVFRTLSTNDAVGRKQIVRLYYSIVCIFVLMGISLSIAIPWLVALVVDESFTRAADIAPWITWAFVVNAARAFLVHFIQFAEKTFWLMLTTLLPAVLHVVISYLMIVVDGVTGAAKAMLISMTVSAVITMVLARKSLHMSWSVRE